MKKYIKTVCNYLLVAALLIMLTMVEKSVLAPFVLLRISVVICICFCLANPGVHSVATSAFCGFFADIYSCNMPVCSLLYLYISSGCVWSVRQFVSVEEKTVFLICFFALLIFGAGEFLLHLLFGGSFFPDLKQLFMYTAFALTNAWYSPIVYGILKRVQF